MLQNIYSVTVQSETLCINSFMTKVPFIEKPVHSANQWISFMKELKGQLISAQCCIFCFVL